MIGLDAERWSFAGSVCKANWLRKAKPVGGHATARAGRAKDSEAEGGGGASFVTDEHGLGIRAVAAVVAATIAAPSVVIGREHREAALNIEFSGQGTL